MLKRNRRRLLWPGAVYVIFVSSSGDVGSATPAGMCCDAAFIIPGPSSVGRSAARPPQRRHLLRRPNLLQQQVEQADCSKLQSTLIDQQDEAGDSSLFVTGRPEEQSPPPMDVAATTSAAQPSSMFAREEQDDSDLQSDPRYAASAWFDVLRQTPRSSVLRSIKGPLLAVLWWSLAWSFLLHHVPILDHIRFPALPHGACISIVSLLLVFRTNAAYQKFNEGRLIWERVLSVSRNLTRLVQLYPEFEFARRQRLNQLLAAFPYLLHQHVMTVQDKALLDQGTNANSKSMPWCLFPNQATVDRCVAAKNRPLWICDRLGQEINAVPYTDNYTNRERSKFLSLVGLLSQSVGECERIHLTNVPLHYARHCLRVLTLWLFTLPLALREYEWWTAALCQGITSWLLWGIYQIGYKIEDPFQGSLRLSTLCDGIYRNVRMERRASAFDVQLDRDPNWKNLPL